MTEFKTVVFVEGNQDRHHDFFQDEIKVIASCCVCDCEIESDFSHLIIDGDYVCDWDCVHDWVKKNFLVKEIK